jgi:tRNA1Val (adenine37-N6)-methyltransferase
MKINTDGVLLGAFAEARQHASILDIGTGTGVIALMLAQRFEAAQIDAVEVDNAAAETAGRNFKNSPFKDRVAVYASSFQDYFEENPERKYDLIITNPPFYIASLKSPMKKKTLAKHTDIAFFDELIQKSSLHLAPGGCFWIIIPIALQQMVSKIAKSCNLSAQMLINVRSYGHSDVHRCIICFGFDELLASLSDLTIYEAAGVYSAAYRELLQSYFLAF